MSDLAISRRAVVQSEPFRMRTVALMLAIGIIGFVGMLVIGAFAPDLRSGRNGGAHALSNAAVGYSGIVQLANATGHTIRIIRSEHEFDMDGLLVVTPDHGWQELGALLRVRSGKPTLLVMPKWNTVADPDHRGWVRVGGVLPAEDPSRLLAPETPFVIQRRRSGGVPLVPTRHFDAAIHFAAPRVLQVITGEQPSPKLKFTRLTSLLTDGKGGMVLLQITGKPLYVLADPDLLSNAGIKDPRQAAAALAMLGWLNSDDVTSIGFDVTFNGLGHSQSPLKLAFTPPFLAMTLALATVLLLVGWHALGRFGPVRPRARAIALGKAVLVENSAKLIRRAGRETALGELYVEMVRERAVATFGIPARLKGAALDAHLDKMGARGGHRFSELARAAEATQDRASLVVAARALHQWQKEKRA
jgi:hypothetical protein